jgi:hypothetical protein
MEQKREREGVEKPGVVRGEGKEDPEALVPYSQSSLAFLTSILEIFSYEIHTILGRYVIVFTFEC